MYYKSASVIILKMESKTELKHIKKVCPETEKGRILMCRSAQNTSLDRVIAKRLARPRTNHHGEAEQLEIRSPDEVAQEIELQRNRRKPLKLIYV